jgi:hypothetical protein
MAFDQTKPATTDNYSTGFVPNLIGNLIALSQWLDTTNTIITGTPPTYAKRYNRTTKLIEEYNGTTWGALPHDIPGNAATATDSTKLNGQSASWYQQALGFTPVQQGGGTGQSTNKTYIGWNTGGTIQLQVDSMNFGSIWPMSVSGNAATVTNGVYTSGNQVLTGIVSITRDGTASDPYGPVSVTRGTANSFSYYGMTRAGQVGWSLGVDTTNRCIWGTGASGAGTITNIVMVLDASGNITTAGNITAYSDERLKKDWAPMPTDFVARLAAVQNGTYSRIDGGLRQVGVSAQSLSGLMPEAVLTDEGGDKLLSVAYGNAALTACIELAREVVALRAEVNALKGRA